MHGDSDHLKEEHVEMVSFLVTRRQAEGGNRMLDSSYDGEFRLPLVLAQASPIFHSSCEGKLGIALE